MTKLNTILFLLTLTLVFACKKKEDNSILGLDVQPASDLLGVTITDSVSVFMHTQKVEKVRSYNDQYKFLGTNQDPIFGRTDASIYTNFSIENNLSNVSFGNNPVVDSAEIVMRFVGKALGDTSTAQQFDVYLLNESLSSDSAYTTNSSAVKSNNPVSSYYGKMQIRGSNVCLVIPLNKTIAQYMLQTTSNLINNTAFQNANKGIYITTSATPSGAPGSGAIRQFDLDDDISGVKLFYHDGNSVSSKGQTAKFPFRGPNALRFNAINHNYGAGASSNLYDQINGAGSSDTLKGSMNVYLNSFGGTRTKVYLPYIKNLTDSQKVSISRAELIIKLDDMISVYNPNYSYPGSLALIACNSAGVEELVFDQLDPSDFVKYGGNYDETNKQYVFNIARQIQKIVSGQTANYGFYLVNADPVRSNVIRRDNRWQRVVFGGKTNLNFKPIFKVTYIKYPYDK